MNFLIVEDKPLAQEYLKKILHSLGYENIYLASSCEEALEVITKHTIDLVFMDININGKTDGIQCAVELNKKDSIPIIYTTAYIDNQTIEETINTNIYGYIHKPFQPSNVQSTLLIALKKIEEQKNEIQKQISALDMEKIKLFENCYFDKLQDKIICNSKHILLSQKETELIKFFINHPQQISSYEAITHEIWENEVSISALRDVIYRLKKKLPDLPLENISKIGYILNI